eukprot:CAMPEP_0203937602 /NCGR_PEP_ID=MMETSP0359-20131031/74814_1 /ASSEMBLY_ACC=CAM_ASM_000338 /TAXON_ID=268821 /ORGANISM="Scrippsiella Hangoei, Strain SHTV-5" /LENGTH=285 /DNA_ID=CAMNT_0050867697 /DNA_START=75 /DNA_END=930 /DNA_ORIENTATION=+
MRSSLVLLIVSGLVLPAFSSLDAAAAEHAAEAAVAAEALDAAALGADDTCLAEGGEEVCALSALQVKKRKVSASMEAAHTGKSEGRDDDADAATHESREHGDGAHKDGYYPSTYSTYSTDSGSPYSTDDSSGATSAAAATTAAPAAPATTAAAAAPATITPTAGAEAITAAPRTTATLSAPGVVLTATQQAALMGAALTGATSTPTAPIPTCRPLLDIAQTPASRGRTAWTRVGAADALIASAETHRHPSRRGTTGYGDANFDLWVFLPRQSSKNGARRCASRSP